MVRLPSGGKASLDVPDLQSAERFFCALGMTVSRRERDALTFSGEGRLRVRRGNDGGQVDLLSDAEPDELRARLTKLGYIVDALPLGAPRYLEVELGGGAVCRIYPG